jgi:putative phage-type endonuclease
MDMRQIMDPCCLRYAMNAAMVARVLCRTVPSCQISVADVDARVLELAQYRRDLAALHLRPQIQQRTPAWYDARGTMITASDIAQALGHGKFGTQKQLYWKKCLPEPDDAFAALANCPPIKWGVMFEDVAQKLYAHRNGTRVHEFGLLRHPSIAHLGASPDGITELGVMLEIKCPYRRQITGEVPLQYYYQIQGQLEVCGLRECDYLEVSFEEVPREEFYASPASLLRDAEQRGIVAEFTDYCPQQPQKRTTQYEYSGIDYVDVELEAFEQVCTSIAASKSQDVRFHYWRIAKYSCVRVVRDDAFVAKMLESVAAVWSKVCEYREDPAKLEAEIGLPSEKRKRSEAVDVAADAVYAFRDTTTDPPPPPPPPPLPPSSPSPPSPRHNNKKKSSPKPSSQASVAAAVAKPRKLRARTVKKEDEEEEDLPMFRDA